MSDPAKENIAAVGDLKHDQPAAARAMNAPAEENTADENAQIAAAQTQLMQRRATLGITSNPAMSSCASSFNAILSRLREHVVSPVHQMSVQEHEELAERRVREILLRRVSECKVPEDEDLREVVLDDGAPETAALRACREFMAWRGKRRCGCVMVVAGVPGAGKTAGACHVLVRTRTDGLFVSATDVIVTPRTGYSEHDARWQRWLSVAVLVVDDLGANSARSDVVTDLLLSRYDRGRCTLVTTNLTSKEIAEVYFSGQQGARLADRLVNAQKRVVPNEGTGVGGHPWYVYARGTSLRNPSAREAFRAQQDNRR